MKKFISYSFIAIFITCFIGAGMALAQDKAVSKHDPSGPYISANIGLAMANDYDVNESDDPSDSNADVFEGITYKDGLAGGLAIGYDFGNPRIEGEVSYQKNDFDSFNVFSGGKHISIGLSGNVTLLSFLVNGYYDFTNSSSFTPYISGGLGCAKISINDILRDDQHQFDEGGTSAHDTVFAYQVGTGVEYAITNRVSLDARYRYFAISDAEFKEETKWEFDSHNVLLGIRVNF